MMTTTVCQLRHLVYQVTENQSNKSNEQVIEVASTRVEKMTNKIDIRVALVKHHSRYRQPNQSLRKSGGKRLSPTPKRLNYIWLRIRREILRQPTRARTKKQNQLNDELLRGVQAFATPDVSSFTSNESTLACLTEVKPNSQLLPHQLQPGSWILYLWTDVQG